MRHMRFEINNVPPNLFNDGYRFVSFDVKSLFTNIPLPKTVNIILKRIYDDKLISMKLTKRALKKLILDSWNSAEIISEIITGKIFENP
jgi:hypothetical protein